MQCYEIVVIDPLPEIIDSDTDKQFNADRNQFQLQGHKSDYLQQPC